MDAGAFETTRRSGFSLRFENGWRISVQWSPFNYGDHYAKRLEGWSEEVYDRPWTSSTAEIAIIHEETDTWYNFDGDGQRTSVKGWQTADEVAAWLAFAASLPPKNEEEGRAREAHRNND